MDNACEIDMLTRKVNELIQQKSNRAKSEKENNTTAENLEQEPQLLRNELNSCTVADNLTQTQREETLKQE